VGEIRQWYATLELLRLAMVVAKHFSVLCDGRRRNSGPRRKINSGIEQLCAAIQKEDALEYDEPPGWSIPARHPFDAVLVKQRRFAEAEQVYCEDLARLPETGWSLLGLAESLPSKTNGQKASVALAKIENIWAITNLAIATSCVLPSAAVDLANSARRETNYSFA
jgi:hypothetical protein